MYEKYINFTQRGYKMLTKRKERFINNYILTLNATKAAEVSGYSIKTAYSQGSRLLRNVEVKEIVTRRLNEINEKKKISRETVLEGLWSIALSGRREADRIAAYTTVAKINKYINDNNIQQVAVNINDVIKDLRDNKDNEYIPINQEEKQEITTT